MSLTNSNGVFPLYFVVFFLMLKTFFCSAVAVQCLETAFEVSTDDQSLAVPMTLPEIFASATAQVE